MPNVISYPCFELRQNPLHHPLAPPNLGDRPSVRGILSWQVVEIIPHRTTLSILLHSSVVDSWGGTLIAKDTAPMSGSRQDQIS